MPQGSLLSREAAIDVWVAGYLHLRAPIDSISTGSHDGLPYARYPLGTRRVEAEFFVSEPEPSQDAARASDSGFAPHWLTVFEHGDMSTESTYRAFGYSLDALEYLMVRPVGCDERFAADEHVQRVIDRLWRSRSTLRMATRRLFRCISPTRPSRSSALLKTQRWSPGGRMVWAHPEHPYVSRVYTAPEHRGRGLATRVMGTLLREVAERGAHSSVLCQRLYMLSRGRIVAAGTPEDVLTPERLREVLLVDAVCGTHPVTGVLQLAFVPRPHTHDA
jgi:GNAT superfamily N-acetyltransferase